MAGLPPGWEWDYDGTRWFYRYKPNGHIQYHFPSEGDEFPDFIDASTPAPDLAPEERLESQQQVKRQASVTSATTTTTRNKDAAWKSRMSASAQPVSYVWDGFGADDEDDEEEVEEEGEASGAVFQPENFMYLGPGAYNDVSPLAEEEDEAARRVVAGGSIQGRVSKGVSPEGSQRTTPLVTTSETAAAVATPPTVPEEPVETVHILDGREMPHELPVEEVFNPVGMIAEMPTEHTAVARIETEPEPVEMADNAVLAPIETYTLPEGVAELPVVVKEEEEKSEPGPERENTREEVEGVQSVKMGKQPESSSAYQPYKPGSAPPRETTSSSNVDSGKRMSVMSLQRETSLSMGPISRTAQAVSHERPSVLSPPQNTTRSQVESTTAVDVGAGAMSQGQPQGMQASQGELSHFPSVLKPARKAVNQSSATTTLQPPTGQPNLEAEALQDPSKAEAGVQKFPSVLRPARGRAPSQPGQQPQFPPTATPSQGNGYVPPKQGQHPPSMTPAPRPPQPPPKAPIAPPKEPIVGMQRVNTLPEGPPADGKAQGPAPVEHPARPSSVMPALGGETRSNVPTQHFRVPSVAEQPPRSASVMPALGGETRTQIPQAALPTAGGQPPRAASVAPAMVGGQYQTLPQQRIQQPARPASAMPSPGRGPYGISPQGGPRQQSTVLPYPDDEPPPLAAVKRQSILPYPEDDRPPPLRASQSGPVGRAAPTPDPRHGRPPLEREVPSQPPTHAVQPTNAPQQQTYEPSLPAQGFRRHSSFGPAAEVSPIDSRHSSVSSMFAMQTPSPMENSRRASSAASLPQGVNSNFTPSPVSSGRSQDPTPTPPSAVSVAFNPPFAVSPPESSQGSGERSYFPAQAQEGQGHAVSAQNKLRKKSITRQEQRRNSLPPAPSPLAGQEPTIPQLLPANAPTPGHLLGRIEEHEESDAMSARSQSPQDTRRSSLQSNQSSRRLSLQSEGAPASPAGYVAPPLQSQKQLLRKPSKAQAAAAAQARAQQEQGVPQGQVQMVPQGQGPVQGHQRQQSGGQGMPPLQPQQQPYAPSQVPQLAQAALQGQKPVQTQQPTQGQQPIQGQMPQGQVNMGQMAPQGGAVAGQIPPQNQRLVQGQPQMGMVPPPGEFPSQMPPQGVPLGQFGRGQIPPGQMLPQGQMPPQGQLGRGQIPHGQMAPQAQFQGRGQPPPGQMPPHGQLGRGQVPPGQMPPQGQFQGLGQPPPGQMPMQGQMPPQGQIPPQAQFQGRGQQPPGPIPPQGQIPPAQRPPHLRTPSTQSQLPAASPQIQIPQRQQTWAAQSPQQGSASPGPGKEKKWLKWLKGGGNKSVTGTPTTPQGFSPQTPSSSGSTAGPAPRWGGGEYAVPAVWQPGQPVSGTGRGQMGPGQVVQGQQMPPGQMVSGQIPPAQIPPSQMPPGQRIPPGQVPQGQMPQGQMLQGQPPLGRVPPSQMPPGQLPPGQVPPGQMMPSGQLPPGQTPQGQPPLGRVPPGQIPPNQIPQPQMRQGQMRPGQLPQGQNIAPGSMPPGQMLPSQIPQGQRPPGQIMQGQIPQGQMPPSSMPPGQMPPNQMLPNQAQPSQAPQGRFPVSQPPPGQMAPTQIPPTQYQPEQKPLAPQGNVGVSPGQGQTAPNAVPAIVQGQEQQGMLQPHTNKPVPSLNASPQSVLSQPDSLQRMDSVSDTASMLSNVEVAEAKSQPVLRPQVIQVQRRSQEIERPAQYQHNPIAQSQAPSSQPQQQGGQYQQVASVNQVQATYQVPAPQQQSSNPVSVANRKPVDQARPMDQKPAFSQVPQANIASASAQPQVLEHSLLPSQKAQSQPPQAPIPEPDRDQSLSPAPLFSGSQPPVSGKASLPSQQKAAAPVVDDKWAKKPVADYSGGDWGDDDDWGY